MSKKKTAFTEIHSRGSEWAKWDLHIHSDASDGKTTCAEIVTEAKKKNLSVIALTDHHTVKNIDEIHRQARNKGIKAISGIEFRTEYGKTSVHLIGLFPEKIGNYDLNSKNLEDLILNPLELSEAKICAAGEADIIKKGGKKPSEEEAFKRGIFLVQVDFKRAARKIQEFGGLVIVHAGSKENSVDREMKHFGKPGVSLYNSLGPVKEELFRGGYIDICEIRKEDDNEDFYLTNFGKPSITGSDSHDTSTIGSKFAWIKADPSFSGLRSIINEPASRVYLGESPEVLSRVSNNATKYIDSLTISSVPKYDFRHGKWFANAEIEFGCELNVIIGNKGSGKSAITDILGLCGHSKQGKDFSFLKSGRFLEEGYAENFQASLKWFAPGIETYKRLDEGIDLNQPEHVRYLPQGYFEEICNEIESLVEFRKEINSVVFQHIPEEKRHGQPTFGAFLEYQKKSIERIVTSKKLVLHELNVKLAALERKRNTNYQSEVRNKHDQLKEELEALSAPKKVSVPGKGKKSNAATDAILSETKELSKTITGLKRQLGTIKRKLRQENDQAEALKQFEREISDWKSSTQTLIQSFSQKLRGIKGININKIITYKIDMKPIRDKLKELQESIAKDSNKVSEYSVKDDSGIEISLLVVLKDAETRLKSLQSKLDEPNKKYQKYKKAYDSWKEKRFKIIGDVKTPNTLKFFEAEMKYLDQTLEKEIAEARKKRISILLDIYSAKREVINIYEDVKKYIEKVIQRNQHRFDEYPLNIIAEFVLSNDTVNSILNFVRKNVVGTYRGTEDAERRLQSQVDLIIPNDIKSITEFLEDLILSFERDERNEKYEQRFIDDQVMDLVAFYDYLYSLDYIQENYELKLGGKSLEKLSPGEKGALLVVFYLLLDKSDIPLILDQPEDNLDNESVSKILVPFLKDARKRRQIIMVTHNPNLAVFADAEQVIRVKIDKEQGNEFKFCSGGIEQDYIKDQVVNVLEGTMPAFNNRSVKYKR